MGLQLQSMYCPMISACMSIVTALLFYRCIVSAAPGNLGGVVLMKNETDWLSLLAFKKEVTLDPSDMLSSWNASLHFCSWPGVTCGRKHRRVVVLNLSSRRLEGTLTPSLGNLSFLSQLFLFNNSFHGEIPQELGRLFRLEYLWLYDNSLYGNIPSNLSNCSNLIELDLSKNELEGGIPAELGCFAGLDFFNLQYNTRLGGYIPPSLGNLTSLTYLGLTLCGLQGEIPHQLGRLSLLYDLLVDENDLHGEIHPSMFSNMSQLQTIQAGENQLSGRFPLDAGASFPNLQILTFANNKMEGYLPQSLWNSTQILGANVGNNNFRGSISEKVGELASMYYFNIGSNQLGGSSENDLGFVTSLINCTQLKLFIAEYNNFQGSLPSSIVNLSTNLETLYLGVNNIYGTIPPEVRNLVNLKYLTLEGCHLTGPIPTTIGEIFNVQQLILADNMLIGTIPGTFGNLSALVELSLSNSRLIGYIPPSLQNCANLDKLNLSSNGLTGQVPPALAQCANLRTLDLNNNSFNGSIPSELLISFASLNYLDLSRNRFTGPLPLQVGNLMNINVLNVSTNQLSGKIPESLGNCLTIEFLHLDNNAFEGNIPTSLGALKELQFVNLSRNKLAGGIPGYFTALKYLKYLDLSYNYLEGNIPIEGIFKNLTAVSLQGNMKLCGGIQQLQFPPCLEHNGYDGHKKAMNFKVILLAVLLAGSVTIVLVLCSIFILRKKAATARKKNSSEQSLEEFRMMLVSYRDIVSATDNFSSSNLIGRGSFGAVYRGVMEADQMVVAVKVFDLEQVGASNSFVSECVALQNIRHRNLVKILTCCSGYDYTNQEFKALVYEFMENGTLESWLHPAVEPSSSLSRQLSLRARLEIAIDVANALDYLHNHSQTPVIHCDLKPSNILLDEEMVAHISDFGLAKILLTANSDSSSQLTSTGKLKGTIGYIPPEYGTSSYLTTQGDVFSYGVILLEMLTGKRPTQEIFNNLTISSYAKRAFPHQLMEIVDHQLLLSMPEGDVPRSISDCILSIAQVGIQCASDNPSDRMDIGTVKSTLEVVRDKYLQGES